MTNQEVQLREYEGSDVDSVWNLHVDGLNQTGTFVYKPELDNDLKDIKGIYLDGSGAFLVALYGSRIVGMGALRKVDDRSAEVKRMRVQIDHQRKGIGTQILDSLIGRANELGYKRLVLDTSLNQTAAQSLYEKRGFGQYRRKGNTLYYELLLRE